MGTDRFNYPRLLRIKQKRILGGVCAGFAYWFGWPTRTMRIMLIILMLIGGFGILTYLILWIFMPATEELPIDYEERTR